jgi:AcrR family transcriptional regulator
MGNRDDLLDAAKRLIATKGYARTTARDIASEANVALASIGYHYGSTQALLNTAMIAAVEEFGDRSGGESAQLQGTASERLDQYLAALIESVQQNRRLWLASFEALVEMDGVPGVQEQLARAMATGQQGSAAVVAEGATEEAGRSIGVVMGAITTGLITQWLIDPEKAASPDEIAAGIRAIAAQLAEPSPLKHELPVVVSASM